MIANQSLKVPRSRFISFLQVSSCFDVADKGIVRRGDVGDLVITSDMPLADEVLKKGCLALSPGGELFTTQTIRERLNICDFTNTLRSTGIQTGGPCGLTDRDKKLFVDQLDKWLTKLMASSVDLKSRGP